MCRIHSRCLLLFLLCAALLSTAACAWSASPIVRPDSRVDANGDRISDSRETRLASGEAAQVQLAPGQPKMLDLIVALNRAPDAGHTRLIKGLGGQVLDSWHSLVYAVRVALPPGLLRRLAALPGVVRPLRSHALLQHPPDQGPSGLALLPGRHQPQHRHHGYGDR